MCKMHNERPLFSIVVPIYNVQKYVGKCVDSLCSQSFHDFEIILVDDGSKDDSGRICDEYASKFSFIKVIHKENGGIVSARQAGVEQSSGIYISCIDGDDWVSIDYFERFKQVIDTYHPDVICCGYYEAYSEVNIAIKHPNREGFYVREDLEKEIFPMLLCNSGGLSFSSSLWAKVFRKEIYQQQQLVSVRVSMGEDEACVKPTIFHSNSMFLFNEPLYYYRQNQDSVTRAPKIFSWDGPEIRAIHLKKQLNLDEFDLKNQLFRSLVFSVFTVAVSQFNSNKSAKEICNNIRNNLERPIYMEAINNCRFINCVKGSLRLFVLKHRIFILMRWYNARNIRRK